MSLVWVGYSELESKREMQREREERKQIGNERNSECRTEREEETEK